MSGARGLSFHTLHACEYEILQMLGVSIKQSESARRLSSYASVANLRDRAFGRYEQCQYAANMIESSCGSLRYRDANILPSKRGRNYYDIIVDKYPQKLGIIVRITKTNKPADYTEHRLRYDDLINILTKDIAYAYRFTDRWYELQLKLNQHKLWDEFDKTEVLYPAATLVQDLAKHLYESHNALFPILWNHYYGMPIFFVTLAKYSVFGTHIDPNSLYRDGYTLSAASKDNIVIEKNGFNGVKIRIHPTSKQASVSKSTLMAGVSFRSLGVETSVPYWLMDGDVSVDENKITVTMPAR